MGLCFRKSISLGKGLKLNLSKSGPSVSFGKSGLRQSIGLNGKTRTTVGIPGTGVYYTKQSSVGKIADVLTGKNKKEDKKADGKSAGKAAAGAAGAGAAAASARSAASQEAAAARQAAAEERAAAKQAAAEEKAAAAEEERKAAEEAVAEYEAHIEEIKSVHKASDGAINWNWVKEGNVAPELKVLVPLAQRVMDGDIDAYFEVIEQVDPFDDLLEYGSGFEIGTDIPNILEVEFQVKSAEVVPQNVLSVTASGKLSDKPLSKGAYYDLVQDYVASTILRVARDSFALLPIDTVLIHATDRVLNTATGIEEDMTLVSCRISRYTVEKINFEFVDPSDALTNFECNMKFKKTAGFEPVDRLLP
ncbi:MAG: DUF4236 domain-containing protein [Clostridiales bacterium]|nr:DUF4236 domain-containing protein [Clostridiales bacterium]